MNYTASRAYEQLEFDFSAPSYLLILSVLSGFHNADTKRYNSISGSVVYIMRGIQDTLPEDAVCDSCGAAMHVHSNREIVPDTYPEWNMNQAIVRFRPKEGLDYHFLYYALLNPETLDDVVQRTKGVVGQANISITQSRNLKIKVPPLPEQQEIVRILDRLLAREQRARQAAEETLTAIERMKQAILARAFRGEL